MRKKVVLFSSNDQSRTLSTRLQVKLKEAGVQAWVSDEKSREAVHSECSGVDLAIVALTGEKRDAERNFDILREAMTVCPVATIFDSTGYGVCLKNGSFPFRLVRFGVKAGAGDFDVSKVRCLATNESDAIIPLRRQDWENENIHDVLRKVDSVLARSRHVVSA